MRSLVLSIERAFLGGSEFYDEGAHVAGGACVFPGVVPAVDECATAREREDCFASNADPARVAGC